VFIAWLRKLAVLDDEVDGIEHVAEYCDHGVGFQHIFAFFSFVHKLD